MSDYQEGSKDKMLGYQEDRKYTCWIIERIASACVGLT